MILNSDTFMAALEGRIVITTMGGEWMTITATSNGTSQAFTVPRSTIKVNEFADAVVKGGR